MSDTPLSDALKSVRIEEAECSNSSPHSYVSNGDALLRLYGNKVVVTRNPFFVSVYLIGNPHPLLFAHDFWDAPFEKGSKIDVPGTPYSIRMDERGNKC